MQDYESKYSGEEIDALLDQVASGGGGGVVDFANDLTGRIEATPEMFTYRPSAGDKSVRDESAVIRRIKGNTSVWGQLISDLSQDDMVKIEKEGDAWIITPMSNVTDPGSTSWGAGWATFKKPHPLNTAHIYLYCVTFTKISKRTDLGDFVPQATLFSLLGWYIRLNADLGQRTTAVLISKPGVNTNVAFLTLNGCVTKIENPMLIDLTDLFGAGNEPSTLEEFRQYYPDEYYPYCAPEVRSMRATGIETVGFNQWDEQWENGTFNTETGENISNNQIRCKNLIRVLPNTYYSLSIGDKNFGIWAMFYDDNQNILQPVKLNSSISSNNCLYISPSGNRNVFLTPENASWMKFYLPVEYGSTTYKGDICINLSHSGVRNGEYEPYEKNTLLLPEIAKYFPEGMHGIGNVCDEINEESAIKRFGVVDLGTLTWNAITTNTSGVYRWQSNVQITRPTQATNEFPNIVCLKYATGTNDNTYAKVDCISVGASGNFRIFDSNYTARDDKDAFVASLQGVLLYYELAEPIYTPIEEPLQLDYKVDDFGTEKMLSNAPSAPFKADIVYQFNAEGRIRDNSRNIERLEDKVKSIAEDSLDTNALNGATAQLKSDIIKEYLNVKPTVRIFHSTDPNKSSIYAYHPYLNEFGDGELVVMRYGKTKMAKWVLDGDERFRKHVTKTGWRECLGAPINLNDYVGEPWKDARFTEPAKLHAGQNNYMTVLEEICARATYDKISLVSGSGEEYEGLASMAQLMALYGINAISVLQGMFYERWENYVSGSVDTEPDYSIFGGKRARVTLGVALRVLNPEFQKLLDEGVLDADRWGQRRWYYDVDNDITIPKYLYSDVCEIYLSKGSMREMINLNLPRMPRLSLKG